MSSSPDSPADQTKDFDPQAGGPEKSPSTDIARHLDTGDVDPSPAKASSAPQHPQRIGAYRIDKLLGKGGFGCVYLAYDEDTQRQVAIKVPLAERVSAPQDAEQYLEEARAVGRLHHAAIVPLYHVGRDEKGLIYIVSKFIEGSDLAKRIANSRPSFAESAQIIAVVAEALHYAHKQGLVHRDIKPANILLDKDNNPYLADFGLALKEEDYGKAGSLAGTPAYMSPEQARGEGHLVEGRSDLFSLGVVFYELLTGKRPFRAGSPREVLQRIRKVEVQPPRQIDDAIPKELERICLKALSKRVTDRYATGLDMADDLNHWQTAPPPDSGLPTPHSAQPSPTGSALNDLPTPPPPKIIPKGLRSFDENDADFFLELLPGPRDREGLPESIRFWKTRIEKTDSDKTFRVGLLYGPSGCGKSSLVKAGLLPRLAEHVLPIYIEATPGDTETRITTSLRKQLPQFTPEAAGLETLAVLRRGELADGGRKVLLVLDQFEQWLHAHCEEENTMLVEALRQCDGEHLQCLVMVRDDFWMAATRFFQALEIALLEGRNFAAVDLFEPLHARKVLSAFGQAYGRLPENIGRLDSQQQAFLDRATGDLTQDGKIICVRLSLFAQMVQGKPWTPDTLKQVGGVTGVGETFLEETFSASTAPPAHRYHQKAARAVLKSMLPQSGADIKGQMKSYQQLLEKSGYASRPNEFDDLIKILDSELRLITPTEDERRMEEENADKDHSSFYQLTHDYLVPSLRAWLTRKQKETRTGRAELRLAERSATWNAKPENRHLPSWWEYANIRLFTSKKNWTGPQRRMMRKAGRLHGLRWGSAVVLLLATVAVIQYAISANRRQNLLRRTQTAVAAMSNSRTVLVPRAIADLEQLPREMVLAELRRQFAADDESRKLSLAYALAHYGQVEIDFLVSQVKDVSADEDGNLATALNASREEALAALQEAAGGADGAKNWRHKARLAILALHLSDASLAGSMCHLQPDPIQRTLFIEECSVWYGDLAALAQKVAECEDGPLRSAVALGVGSVSLEGLNSPEKQTWEKVLLNWYQNEPDSATHSAADWALRKWKLAPPQIAVSKKPAEGYDWHVNSVGMTMLRIPDGRFTREVTDPKDRRKRSAIQQEVTISRSFLLSDREVTRRQFQRFMDNRNYPAKEKPKDWTGAYEEYSPTEQHPVQQVNWYDAIQFCNWLSHKEGLKPRYVRTGEKVKSRNYDGREVEHDAWRLIPEADGYHLPTEAQ